MKSWKREASWELYSSFETKQHVCVCVCVLFIYMNIYVAISLHQGPEGAAAGGEGKGRSGACGPTQAIHMSNSPAI